MDSIGAILSQEREKPHAKALPKDIGFDGSRRCGYSGLGQKQGEFGRT
jgi:hypothetical protein